MAQERPKADLALSCKQNLNNQKEGLEFGLDFKILRHHKTRTFHLQKVVWLPTLHHKHASHKMLTKWLVYHSTHGTCTEPFFYTLH